MYQVSVWRRIDLRERYNLPFAGSGVAKLDGIVQNIYEAAVKDSILQPFKDENLSIPLKVEEFKRAFWNRSEPVSDTDTTPNKILGPADIYFIDFKEDFVFDRQHSQIKFDIKYISLVMDKEVNMPKAFNDSTGAVLSEKVVAYFRYDDFINFFKKHPTARWINFENISESKTYPQAFARRDFRSVITKFTNEKDFTILSLVDKKITDSEKRKFQAYLDALAYEYKLLDFENSLWEW
jgi:gliding motility associated protien GldN